MPNLPAGLQDLVLSFPNSAVNLPTLTVGGYLDLTAGGDITQSGALTVQGTGGSTLTSAGTVTFSQNSSFGGDLSVISTAAGPATTINQTGGTLSVAGQSTFQVASGKSISVGQSANSFTGTVSFAASSGQLGSVTVGSSTALGLGALNLGGNLSVAAAGITQTGAWVVVGNTSLT
ncbi:MAG: hypothetical protein EB090_06005, partial [Verrucomicrobia bacterium]|nr:hypothetical protein [Verrucomicrobiota bacterium]